MVDMDGAANEISYILVYLYIGYSLVRSQLELLVLYIKFEIEILKTCVYFVKHLP
jgi:hypothetical protein